MKKTVSFLILLSIAFAFAVSCGAAGGSEADQLINEYEQVVKKAKELGAKVEAGDLSVMGEAFELAGKMMEIGQKLEGMTLTDAQQKRIEDISNLLE